MHHTDYNEWMNDHAKKRREEQKKLQRKEIDRNFRRKERWEDVYRWIATGALLGVVGYMGYVMWVTR